MPVSPERLEQARKHLLKVNARTGGMPSIAAFAKEMRYSSPASAFELTERLVAAGFLAKSPSGRLLPGPAFHALKILVSDEMLALLPEGVKPEVLRVQDDSMVDAGILEGDCLVVIPYEGSATGQCEVGQLDVARHYESDVGASSLALLALQAAVVTPRRAPARERLLLLREGATSLAGWSTGAPTGDAKASVSTVAGAGTRRLVRRSGSQFGGQVATSAVHVVELI